MLQNQCPAHRHKAEPQQPRRASMFLWHEPWQGPHDHVPRASNTTPAPCSREQHGQPGREQERQTLGVAMEGN